MMDKTHHSLFSDCRAVMQNRIIVLGWLVLMMSVCACQREKSRQDADAEHSQVSNSQFGEFYVRDLDRKELSLAEEISKNDLTIIDFWASWCAPCQAEIPIIKNIYSEYSGKGLGIIGVSLDTDYNAWKKSIEDNDMPWTHVSELRGWNSTIVERNNITAIPYTYVLDKQGNVLAQGLRGGDLISFIDKSLNR